MRRNQRRDSWLALLVELSGRPLVTVLRRELLLAAECCPSLGGSQPASLAVDLTNQCHDFWDDGLIDVGLGWNGGDWAREAVVAISDADDDQHFEEVLRRHRPGLRREMARHRHLVALARTTGSMEDALAVARYSSTSKARSQGIRVHCYRLEPRGWVEGLEARSRLESARIPIEPVWELPASRRPRSLRTSLQDLLRLDENEQRNLARIKSLAAKHAALRGGRRERK